MDSTENSKDLEFNYDDIVNKLNNKKALISGSLAYVFNPSVDGIDRAISTLQVTPKPTGIYRDAPRVYMREIALANDLITRLGSQDAASFNTFNYQNETKSILGAFYEKLNKLVEGYGIDITKDIDYQLAFAELRHNLWEADARNEAYFIHFLALSEEEHKKDMARIEELKNTILQNEEVIMALSMDCADLEKQVQVLADQLAHHDEKRDYSRPFNYHYPTIMIETALLSIIYAKNSYRGARKMLEIFNEMQFGPKFDRIPSHVCIGNWSHIVGYDVQEHNHKIDLLKKGYHIIVDQSVSVGSQQLLLILAVPDKRAWDHALTPKDVTIGFMKSAAHWTNQDVADAVEKVSKKYDRKPTYCVSDGASNLKTAMEKLNIPQHQDIGHKFANYFKQVYNKCEDFKQWCKACGDTRRFYLSELGYMMAPGIRSKCRFMNVFLPAMWSWKIIQNYRKFNRLEEMAYEPILKYCSLVEEIMEIQSAYNEVFKILKVKGLSLDTYKESKAILNHWISPGTERQRDLKRLLLEYLKQEVLIVKAEEEARIKANEKDVKVVHDISSDVIESMFGTMKRMMPDCKFFGITTNVLSLDLYTEIAKPSDIHSLGVEARLKRSHIKDIFKWEGEFLCESLLAKRKEKLKTGKFTILEIA